MVLWLAKMRAARPFCFQRSNSVYFRSWGSWLNFWVIFCKKDTSYSARRGMLWTDQWHGKKGGVYLVNKRVVNLRKMWHLLTSGAIIGDGDRKCWDPRGPMIWDNFSIFRTNCAVLTSYIHARVVVSRVDVVTLRDLILIIARFSCGFFTIWQVIGNQGSSMYFCAPS